MRYLLIYSIKDPAGVNIKNNLDYLFNESSYTFKKNIDFFESDKDLVELSQEDLPKNYNYYIFLSKHKSGGKNPSAALTVHTSGNLTIDNSYGGNPEELCPCNGILNTIMLKNINREYLKIINNNNNTSDNEVLDNGNNNNNNTSIKISFEGVHHGPSDLEIPSVFVEIGSTESEWKNDVLGRIIGRSILSTIEALERENYDKDVDRIICFGGGHYAPKFTKLALEGKYYVGYIVPKYAKVSHKVLNQMVEKQDFDCVIFDWKGLKSEDKKKYIRFFENNSILWKRV